MVRRSLFELLQEINGEIACALANRLKQFLAGHTIDRAQFELAQDRNHGLSSTLDWKRLERSALQERCRQSVTRLPFGLKLIQVT